MPAEAGYPGPLPERAARSQAGWFRQNVLGKSTSKKKAGPSAGQASTGAHKKRFFRKLSGYQRPPLELDKGGRP